MDVVCSCRDFLCDAYLLRRWQSVGKSRGLSTDREIATFLLDQFERKEGNTKLCSQCGAQLRLCCVKCQLLSQPPHPSVSQVQVSANLPPQQTVISGQCGLHRISSLLPIATEKKLTGDTWRTDVRTFSHGHSLHTTNNSDGDSYHNEGDDVEVKAEVAAYSFDDDEDNGDDMRTVSSHSTADYPDTSNLQCSKASAKYSEKHSTASNPKGNRQPATSRKGRTNKRTPTQKTSSAKTGKASYSKDVKLAPNEMQVNDGEKNDTAPNKMQVSVGEGNNSVNPVKPTVASTLLSGGHSRVTWVKDEGQSDGETLETVPCVTESSSTRAKSVVSVKEEKTSSSGKRLLASKMKRRNQGDGVKVTCTVCHALVSKRYLKYHMETHGERKSYVCDICGAVYKQWRNLRIHHRTHSGEAPYKCDQCGASFKLGLQLKDHVSVKHTSVYTHVCEECGVGFNLPSRLKKHMRVHTGEKPHQCGDCGWRFSQVSLLKTHWQAKHSGQTPFKCLECDAAYSNKHALSIHRRKHERQRSANTVEKKYICDVCGHASATATMLKTHMISHTDERPFTCQQCGSSYKTQLMLGRHIKLCGKEKPFECNICNSRFTTKNSLKEHTNIHTGQNRYKCDFCAGEFNTRLGWKIHRRKHTGEKPYACSECGARFAAIAYLYSHRLTHSDHKPFACTLCDAKFARNNGLKNHMVVHSEEKAHVCSVCGGRYPRQYYLKVHMRLKHTGEKPFRCPQCDSAFALTRDLKKHVQRMHTTST